MAKLKPKMARTARDRLSPGDLKKSEPGLYHDGGGLYLQVTCDDAGAVRRSWLYRYATGEVVISAKSGKPYQQERWMGLGALADVKTLREAREARDAARKLGKDPIAERDRQAEQRRINAAKAAARTMTFDDCAKLYIDENKRTWTNAKHREQWETSLATYASPVFGSLPIDAIDKHLVAKALKPIWISKIETANRLRGRIETVLEMATARDYRQGDNPARLSIQAGLLPNRSEEDKAVQHLAAMPSADVPAFMAALAEWP